MSSSLRQKRRSRTTSAVVDAALSLFAERGYAAVTVSEVAAAAGVAERTLYRYFADKEELLFSGDAQLQQALRHGIEQQPVGHPFVMLRGASMAVARELQGQQEALRRRALIVASTPALVAREQAKHAIWASVLADALVVRGTKRAEASLLGRIAVACYGEAMSSWLERSCREQPSPEHRPDDRTLPAELEVVFDRLGTLLV